MNILKKNNVKVFGEGPKTLVFAHGFGCDQNMWRFLWPKFADNYRIILFDHVGCGRSDLNEYDAQKYAKLDGYAEDIIDLCRALDVKNSIFIGHSVSAMMGVIASRIDKDVFDDIVMICPSPRYIDDIDYTGGFSEREILELLDFLDENYVGWSQAIAPSIMGNSDRPHLSEELANSFCATDPEIAKRFARVTFLSDNRADLALVPARCLVLQCSEDVIAPLSVGDYVNANLPRSTLVVLNATGHCPNLSAPEETVAAIKGFLGASAL